MQDFSYRPKYFSDFIGKDNLKQNLKVYIDSCIKQNKTLDHVLLHGIPGIGKTSLATVIANELNTKIHYLQGPSIRQISDVLDITMSIKENEVVFIDEVHNVDPKCMELIYSMMEDFVIDIKLGKSLNSQYTRFNIPKFTLIVSTNYLSKLPEPFIERFGIKFFIDNYSEYEILEILERINSNLSNKLDKKEIILLSKHSKGIPRIAINLYKRFLDFKLVSNIQDPYKILKTIGIFSDGLEQQDISYLRILNEHSKPIGLRSLSQTLDLDYRTIELKIEPYLLKKNYIIKTKTGRFITNKGKEVLDKI